MRGYLIYNISNMRLSFQTENRKQVVDITEDVQHEIQKANCQSGMCVLFIKHTTACLTTADLDPGTDLDMLDAFEALMPKLSYRHPHNPGHVTDHILSSIIGPCIIIPVVQGQLDLGIWQRIVLIELDGPRTREITLSIL
jgi:secondary thiamine-phosphate synthase enzyme